MRPPDFSTAHPLKPEGAQTPFPSSGRILAGLLLLLACWPANAPANAPAGAPSPGHVSLPGITVHAGSNAFLELTGRFCGPDVELLEFLAVEQGGRDYESLLSLDCRPSSLQTALLLLGLKPHPSARTALQLEVEWQENGQSKCLPVEKLLLERRSGKPPPSATWIFTGSLFVRDPDSGRDVFQADAEAALVALYSNPSMVLNLSGDFGTPYRGPEAGFTVDRKSAPPPNSPIKLILRRAPQTSP